MEPFIFRAFTAGFISAASMPLGTLTILFWRPKDRFLGFLIAFGGGALLSALVLDLVSSALERGHITELTVGSLAGSLFFIGANTLVNQYGGFLRKPSTLLEHMSRQQAKRFKDVLRNLKRIDIFKHLPADDLQAIAQSLLVGRYDKGTILYQRHDPCESLYILEDGGVEFREDDADAPKRVEPNSTFSRLSFFTGTPHTCEGVVTEDSQIGILPKSDFEELLQTLPELAIATQHFLQGEEVAHHLRHHYGFSDTQIKTWVTDAIQSIKTTGTIPDALVVGRRSEDFQRIARQITRLPIFQHLSEEDIDVISERVLYQTYEMGHTFFHAQEAADRLFVVEQGEVELIDPKNTERKSALLHPYEAFGSMSLLTGGAHSVTAIANSPVGVWELRKQDFDELLRQTPALEEAVKAFLQEKAIATYLQQKQGFQPAKSAEWAQNAMRQVESGDTIPSIKEMTDVLEGHANAPLSIWLGLLIDGIPESLTIGSSVLLGSVSPTLIVGLFVSNYPEALSSSEGMRQQGFPFPRILMLWTSIMIVQGIVAAFGSVILGDAPERLVSVIEAFGAGAMLTVISQTMLPEAYTKRGFFTGLATLLGFLVIVYVKSFEGV